MSETLRADIKSKANQLFQPAIEKAESKLAKDYYQRLFDHLYEIKVSNHYMFKKIPINNWPSEWLETAKGFTVVIDEEHGNATKQGNRITSLNLSHKQIPKCAEEWPVNWNGILDFKRVNDCNSDLITEYRNYQAGIKKERDKKMNFINELSSILERCNTLKQFLNAWPQGENLVPADVMRTYNAPPEKRVNPLEHIAPEVSTELSVALLKQTIVNKANK
jgi:hypothetical protein